MYGRVYVFIEDLDAEPCEFQQYGGSQQLYADGEDISDLFGQVGTYLVDRKLHGTLGLTIMDHESQRNLVELETDDGGTVTFDLDDVSDEQDLQITNWKVHGGDGTIFLKGNESHAFKKGDTEHQKFKDGRII